MTKKEMRIAIAEACGWERFVPQNPSVYMHRSDSLEAHIVPNYPEDLNAMHEAEKKLSLEERHICDRERRMVSVGEWLVPTATVGQRAEAFLRTIGKWKDSSGD